MSPMTDKLDKLDACSKGIEAFDALIAWSIYHIIMRTIGNTKKIGNTKSGSY